MICHKLRLLEKKQICENTFAFSFQPDENYIFKAGQYAHFRLKDPVHSDKRGNSRAFSFANSPVRNKLMIAARSGKSVFLKNLLELKKNDVIFTDKPKGDLTAENIKKEEIVFIAGGIGITPIRSIIEDHILRKKRRKLHLFYSNRKSSQIAFFEDFLKWDMENKNFKFIPVINIEEKDWEYETGSIDGKMLLKYLMDFRNKVFFIVGPPVMVNCISEILLNQKVGKKNIIVERF